MSKIINFDTEARNKLKKGIDLLANSVKVTLGPKGRNVIIEKQYGPPHITKDGVTVAKEIELKDPFENLGAQLIKNVASKTCDDSGDGTTSASVLAQAIFNEGLKNITAGTNPLSIKKGIDLAVAEVVSYIRDTAIPVDTNKIKQVATISANNDTEIGDLIAEAFSKVTKDGVITIETSKGTDTYINVVEGMRFDRGFLSPYFATNNEQQECILENAYILIYNGKINNIKDILHILENTIQTNKPLLIICDDIDSEALTTLVANKIRNGLRICAVKSPGFGINKKDYLEDIAVVTGGVAVSEELGMSLNKVSSQMLGVCEKVIINKNSTTIINGAGNKEKIQQRYNELVTQKEHANTQEQSKLTERIAKIAGGVAVIYVGANSEIEIKEKKDRVEDALCATRAALEEGVLPGGSTTYINALPLIEELSKKYSKDDLSIGIDIIYRALQAPIKQIAANAGECGEIIINKLLNSEPNIGYDAKNGIYCNMLDSGILDPAKVERVALENAASVAGLMLTAGCVICSDKATEVFTTPEFR